MNELRESIDSDGIAYTAGTSQGIAYMRMQESKRKDRLFNDHLAHHFIGERGERIGQMLDDVSSILHSVDDYIAILVATRTKCINDHLDKWITSMEANGEKMQVTNLGCGVDTRPFWVESLKKVE